MNERLRALRAIDRRAVVVYDVAVEHGQMVENVQHMRWFVDAVADALRLDKKVRTK